MNPPAPPTPLHGRRQPSTAQTSAAGYEVEGSLALKSQGLPVEHPQAVPRSSAIVTRSATIVARALLEVLSGWRPPCQLSRWTSYALQQDLERRVPRRPTGTRLQLLRVRVTEPAEGVAEVCALAQDMTRKRVRVIALRMEQREDGWIVTRLQTG